MVDNSKFQKIIDSFWNENEMNFFEYFEKHRKENLINREDYYNLENKYNIIAEKYPKAVDFLENENINELLQEEQNAIFELINLREKIKEIELKECYKLGFKDAYIFFKEMKMLDI